MSMIEIEVDYSQEVRLLMNHENIQKQQKYFKQ